MDHDFNCTVLPFSETFQNHMVHATGLYVNISTPPQTNILVHMSICARIHVQTANSNLLTVTDLQFYNLLIKTDVNILKDTSNNLFGLVFLILDV